MVEVLKNKKSMQYKTCNVTYTTDFFNALPPYFLLNISSRNQFETFPKAAMKKFNYFLSTFVQRLQFYEILLFLLFSLVLQCPTLF